MEWRRLLCRSGTLAAACALALTGDATALGTYHSTDSITVTADHSAGRAVPCPAGMKAVGGGAVMSGSSTSSSINTSAPFDTNVSDPDKVPDDGWVGAGSAAAAGNETLTVHVICATGRFRYVSAKREFPLGAQGKAKAKCPRGTRAISGGVDAFDRTFRPYTVMMRSVPIGSRTWAGRAYNGSARKQKMKVWAICSKAETRFTNISNTNPIFADNTQDSLETESCSESEFTVTGLGAEVIGTPLGTEIAGIIPTDLDAGTARDDGARAWFNNTSGSSQRMSVTAICARV